MIISCGNAVVPNRFKAIPSLPISGSFSSSSIGKLKPKSLAQDSHVYGRPQSDPRPITTNPESAYTSNISCDIGASDSQNGHHEVKVTNHITE